MRRLAVLSVTAVVTAAGLTAFEAPALAAPWRPAVQHEKSVPGRALTPRAKPADPHASSVLRSAPSVRWPGAEAVTTTPGA